MRVGRQHHAPAALPPGKTPYPLYRKLGGPQGRSGQVRKISPPQEFDPRTVQPVASRYTYYATYLLPVLTLNEFYVLSTECNVVLCTELREKSHC